MTVADDVAHADKVENIVGEVDTVPDIREETDIDGVVVSVLLP